MARVYLDSCIVIYLIQGHESLRREILSALRPAQEPLTACVSDLTRLECRVGPMREDDGDLLRQFDDFFASRDLENLPIDVSVFDLATSLRASHGTKTPDALHLATAVIGGCAEFWTNDGRLRAAAEGRIGLRVLPAVSGSP
jgi:predicted nucleic acid-binding protein